MIDLDLFFKEKPAVPDWFKNHEVFKEIKQVNKIFPSIGLPNFTVESKLDNSTASTLVIGLCTSIRTYLNNAKYYFSTQAHHFTAAMQKSKNTNTNTNTNTNRFTPASTLIDQLYSQLDKPKIFVTQFNTKGGLYLYKDIVDSNDQVFAKKGEGLFKVYQKLVDFCSKHYNYNLTDLSTNHTFKEYSANNVNGKLQVIFSSDGIDGAWDILTMSQRGISSCQSWNGQYKNCTIGSVLDPFTAIIYLTAGTPTEFGSKMIRRCIVRFAVDRFMKRPCLFLEYMYPNEHQATMKAFKDALRSKIGDKFPIVSLHKSSSERYYVPYNPTSETLLKHSDATYINTRGSHNYHSIFPYRDTYMEYKLKNPLTSKESNYESLKAKKLNELGTTLNAQTEISSNYITLIKNILQDEVFAKIDKNRCTTNDDYLRSCCIKYFATRSALTKQICSKILSQMKTDKDKSIFIPGVQQVKPTKPVKKALKVPSTTIVTNEKTNAIEEAVEKHIIPITSTMFKSIWGDIVSNNTKKIKAKIKKKSGVVAVRI